jgi:hypothetical protein
MKNKFNPKRNHKELGLLTGASFNLKKHNKKMRLIKESRGLEQ